MTRQFESLEAYDSDYRMNVGYSVDKGWLWAVDHFAQCILNGQAPVLARAQDGFEAARITEASIQSRESGRIVPIHRSASGAQRL
jgi:predicted dehydrogenase